MGEANAQNGKDRRVDRAARVSGVPAPEAQLRVLMLTPMEPTPPIGGARSVYHSDIELLRSRGHEVHVLSITGDPNARAADLEPLATGEYFYAVKPSRLRQGLSNLGSRVPFSVERHRNESLITRAVERIRAGQVDVVVLHELLMAEYARLLPAEVPVPVYFRGLTVHTAVVERFYRAARNPLLRFLAWRQFRKCADFEARIVREADGVSQISQVDAETIRSASGRDDIRVLFPSVDFEAFPLAPSDAREPATVIHCGTLEPITTLPAMLWLAREVWPRVRARRPDARLDLVGRATPSPLDALGAEGVDMLGPVPDMIPHLARGAVFVSPMFTGSGVRISLLNAMATGNAIVATRVAAEGIPYTNGQDMFVTDDAQEFGEAICRLLDDPKLRRDLGQRARKTVESGLFTRAENALRLEEQLRETIENHARRTT